ncbi:hypothetical protein [Brevundimonas sp.]|jgi:hypothetical protein|uniref:hypothetical protein n=1 Tax=Brevundimonas sp. TaxID=1871086 RepID=UPI00378403EF
MPQPEEVPVTTADPRTVLALSIIDGAKASGFARAINPFTKEPRAGDYMLLAARSVSKELNPRRLTIALTDGGSASYLLVREPVSCNWMAVENFGHADRDFSNDVFDLLWLSRPFSTYATRDELMEVVLLHHGFLAPWMATRRAGLTARLRLDQRWLRWRKAFLDASDFNTYHCPGCDDCDGGVGTVHRLFREPNVDL